MIFPEFKDLGYHTYVVQGRFLGYDEDGNPRFARRTELELWFGSNRYKELFYTTIVRDKKDTLINLKFKTYYGYVFEAPYTEQGYELFKKELLKEVEWSIKLLTEMKDDLSKEDLKV